MLLRKRRSGTIASVCFGMILALMLAGSTSLWDTGVQQGGSTGGAMPGSLFALIAAGFAGVAVALLLGCPAGGDWRKLVAFPLSILALLGYCLLSAGWAIDSIISMRRLALTGLSMWTIWRCVEVLGYDRIIRLVRWALLGLLVLNYLVLIVSDMGVQPFVLGEDPTIVGLWRGIFQHKNQAGANCAITIVLFLFDRKRFSAWLGAAAILLSAAFLVFSESKTSYGVLLASIMMGVLAGYYRGRYRGLLLACGLFAAIGLVPLAGTYFGVLIDILDDPGAITGRSQIWSILLRYASDHLALGSGYASFWLIGDASPVWDYTSGWVATSVGHGHNGFLDLLVTIGLPGVILAIVVLFVWPFAQLAMSLEIRSEQRSLLTAMLVFCAGYNMTESGIINGVGEVQIFLVITVALISMLARNSSGQHQRMRRRALGLLRA
jgi:O-antigen ligase